MDSRLLLLSPKDNCYSVKRRILSGESFQISGIKITPQETISLGFKVACKSIKKGEKIIKWGMSIGRSTDNIRIGEVIHTHNLASDYLPTYKREKQKEFFQQSLH